MRGNRRDQERTEKSGALNPNKLGSPRILLDRNYRVELIISIIIIFIIIIIIVVVFSNF